MKTSSQGRQLASHLWQMLSQSTSNYIGPIRENLGLLIAWTVSVCPSSRHSKQQNASESSYCPPLNGRGGTEMRKLFSMRGQLCNYLCLHMQLGSYTVSGREIPKYFLILRRFRKIAISDYYLCHVCPSVRI